MGAPAIGVLYVNLGSPSAPTTSAVRAFLDEFLGDPLVVDVNRFLWWLIRKGIVLPFRGPKSAALYRSIWAPEGSPLLVFSRRFASELAGELGAGFHVTLAMRYGRPSLAEGLDELVRAGCERVVVLTAFPQASRTTTGTVERALRAEVERRGGEPRLEFVPAYFADPGYVAALAESVREAAGGTRADAMVFSFHGLPQRYVDGGDPYREHCEATARALAAALELSPGDWRMAYQSRFGREPWLEPDVTSVAPELARGGKRVLVCAPSFTTDCLETLEELGQRLREECERHGGEMLLVPCLNARPAWVRAAAALVRVRCRGGEGSDGSGGVSGR